MQIHHLEYKFRRIIVVTRLITFLKILVIKFELKIMSLIELAFNMSF